MLYWCWKTTGMILYQLSESFYCHCFVVLFNILKLHTCFFSAFSSKLFGLLRFWFCHTDFTPCCCLLVFNKTISIGHRKRIFSTLNILMHWYIYTPSLLILFNLTNTEITTVMLTVVTVKSHFLMSPFSPEAVIYWNICPFVGSFGVVFAI